MAARIDIPSVYDEVRKAYADMGYPVSGDRLVLSEQPTYVDGRPVPKDVIRPNSSGGSTQDDGTVRINPRYRAVMRHWGLKGSGRDFLRTIIGHELGHHIDRTVFGGRSAERRRLLREISRSGFHTVYTDSYGPDTNPRKLDKELLAEYLAKQVSDRLGKRASAAEFRDGTYDDVKAVYDALTDKEKDFVTPHRRVYKDVTPLARTVAYSDGAPVGFADLYGKKGRASLCLAVAKAARGKGLAGEMARTSIRKLLNAMAEEKLKAREAGGSELEAWRKQSRIRRFVWGLDARNDRSARAAARAGFTEQEFKKPHKYRRFVMTRGEAERMRDKAEKKAADRNFLSAFGDLANMPQTASNPSDADIRAAFRVDPAKVRGHDTVPHFMAAVENVNPSMGRALWGMAKGRVLPRVSVFSGSTPRSLGSTADAVVAARQSWPNGANTAYAALTNMYDRAGRKTGRPVWDVQRARPTPYGMRRDGVGVQVR